MAVIYLNTKLRQTGRSRGNMLRASQERTRKRRGTIEDALDKAKPDAIEDDKDILKHEYDAELNEEEPERPADETQVIRRPERKRKARRVTASEASLSEQESIFDEQSDDADK